MFALGACSASRDARQLIVGDRRRPALPALQRRAFPSASASIGGDCFAAIRPRTSSSTTPTRASTSSCSSCSRRRAIPRSSRSSRRSTAPARTSPIVDGADRGGRGRQVGDRAGRAQGALRRGGEHPLGARPGARRRAGRLRLHRPEDPRQGLAGRAPRGRRRCAPMSISAPATTTRSPRKIYTDLSLLHLRSRRSCRDAARLFNYMTGYARPASWRSIAVAPLNLRARCSS